MYCSTVIFKTCYSPGDQAVRDIMSGFHFFTLIRFEPVQAIDDQHVDGSSIGHYFEAELFLKRSKD
jgi:hypothetical protein